MDISDNHNALRHRLAVTRSALLTATVISLTAVVARGMLIQPSIGIPDVHLPPNVDLPVTGHALGDMIGQIPHAIALLLQIGMAVAVLLLIWALVKHRKNLIKFCLLFMMVKTLIGPIPVMIESQAPTAIDLPAAKRLIGPISATTPDDPIWKRYIAAQMAYIEGDHATARRLSVGLDGEELGSRLEAVYRVGVLQGREPKTTNVCLIHGCLSPRMLAPARTTTVALAVLAAVAAILVGAFCHMLHARLERIDALRAKVRARTVTQRTLRTRSVSQ